MLLAKCVPVRGAPVMQTTSGDEGSGFGCANPEDALAISEGAFRLSSPIDGGSTIGCAGAGWATVSWREGRGGCLLAGDGDRVRLVDRAPRARSAPLGPSNPVGKISGRNATSFSFAIRDRTPARLVALRQRA